MNSNIRTTAIRQIDPAGARSARERRFGGQRSAYNLTTFETAQRSRERRASCRFAIDLPVQYHIGRNERARTGEGRVINFSSSGLLIRSDHPMDSGVAIRLRVEWPARLNNSVPLALHIEGRTVRVNGVLTAVAIMKSEFRIRPCHTEAVRQAG